MDDLKKLMALLVTCLLTTGYADAKEIPDRGFRDREILREERVPRPPRCRPCDDDLVKTPKCVRAAEKCSYRGDTAGLYINPPCCCPCPRDIVY